MTTNVLMDCSLEISIWDYEKNSGSHFLGGVRMNLGTYSVYNFVLILKQEVVTIMVIHVIGWMLPKKKYQFGKECLKNLELLQEKHYHYVKGC